MTKSGVGYSEKVNSNEAGTEAAQQALASSKISGRKVALLFSTAKHNPKELLSSVLSVLGADTKIYGGSVCGIISKEKVSYNGFEVGLAVFSADEVKIDGHIVRNIKGRELESGVELGQQLASRKFAEDDTLFVGFEAIRGEGPTQLLNFGTPILEGMSQSLKSWPNTIGAAFQGDFNFQSSFTFFDSEVETAAAIALIISGKKSRSVLMHGCTPMSDYYKITKCAGNVVLEIDGKPALERVSEILGPGSDKTWEEYPLYLNFGRNHGDKFDDFIEERYTNNMCVAIDPPSKALVLFEPSFKEGDEFQLMRRHKEFNTMEERLDGFFKEGKAPFFNLYVDCVGRSGMLMGTETEDATVVQKFVKDAPAAFLGIYGGREIAKFGAQPAVVCLTGVLTSFAD